MQFGPYDARAVSDGSYRLDGGAMFGVVPRVLWEQPHPPDARNRVELALTCLLLRGEGRTILVDNGMGDRWDARERERYAISRPAGGLMDDLARHGVARAQVTDVVLTHLHFDHCGGSLVWEGEQPRLAFPNATYWVQQQNLDWAMHPSDRDRRSFHGHDIELLMGFGDRVHVLRGPGEFLPALTALLVSGHTPGQQLVLVGTGSNALLYCGDLIPFASHVRLPWIMAFDLHPLLTLEEKKQLLAQAAAEGWTLVFGHDPNVTACKVAYRDGDFLVRDQIEL